MKKQYISPELKQVALNFKPALMAGSFNANELNSDQNVQLDNEVYNEGFGGRGTDYDW